MSLGWSRVKTIEGYLDAALKIDPGEAHFYYLLALLKYDYYLTNGLRISPPTIDDLLVRAESATCRPAELEQMLRHAPVPPSRMTEAILGSC